MIIGATIEIGSSESLGSVTPILQTFDSPFPFLANSIKTDTVNLTWIDIGADNYVLESANDAGFTIGLTTEYSGTNTDFELTGLSTNTTKYFRLKAQKSGFYDSAYVYDQATTFPFVPLAYYDFRGLDSVSNDYADNASVATYNYIKSVINASGPTLTSTGTLGGIIYGQLARWTASPLYSHNQLHTPSSSFVFSGDFEVNWGITFTSTPNNSSILFNSANTQRIRMVSLSSVQFGTNSAITLTNPLELNKFYWVTFQRSGTTFTIIVRDNEGNITSNSGTVAGTSVTFDRVFFASAIFRSQSLFLTDRVLTSDERIAGQNIVKRSVVPSEPINTNLPVKGITLSPFTGPYLVNTELDYAASGGLQRNSFYGFGDYQFALTAKLRASPYYGEDLLYIFKSNNQVNTPIPLGVPSTVIDDHNIGSICLWNNIVVHFEQNIHYDKGLLNTLVVKMFGKDMNFVNYKEIPLFKGVAASVGANLQYHQAYVLNDKIYIIAQEWSAGSEGNLARRIVLLISDDGWNYFKKYQLLESDNGDGDFLYPITAYNEDQLLVVVEHRQQPELFSRAIYIFKIDPATETIVRSIDGSFTKNVATSGPVTITEAEADLLMGTAYSATTAVKESSILYNPATEIAHCVRGNGTEDGLILAIIDVDGGTITEKAIPEVIGGHNIDVDFTTQASLSNNTPFVYVEGSNMYLVCGEPNGGNTKIIRCISSDNGDTWDFYDQISADDTKQHTRFMPTKNWYYTQNRKIFASKIESDHADLLVYTVSTP